MIENQRQNKEFNKENQRQSNYKWKRLKTNIGKKYFYMYSNTFNRILYVTMKKEPHIEISRTC